MDTLSRFAPRMLLSLTMLVIGPVPAQPLITAVKTAPVANLSVLVDPPTGFVFVKLPSGWKFVGAVDRATLNELPPHVLTTLQTPADAVPAAEDRDR